MPYSNSPRPDTRVLRPQIAIAVALILAFASAAYAQQPATTSPSVPTTTPNAATTTAPAAAPAAPPMSKNSVADLIENGTVDYMCGAGPQIMSCLGADPRKDHGQCVSTIQSVSPQCKDRLMKELPDHPTKDQIHSATQNYIMCVTVNSATARSKSMTELNTCMGAQQQVNH